MANKHWRSLKQVKETLRVCNSFSDNLGMSNDLQHTRTPSWATDLVLRMRWVLKKKISSISFRGKEVPWMWQNRRKNSFFLLKRACDTDLGPKILAARSMTILARSTNYSSSAHSRPQSPSFLGHLVGKRGALEAAVTGCQKISDIRSRMCRSYKYHCSCS